MIRCLLLAVILVTIPGLMEGHTKSECGVAQTAFGMCVPYLMGLERRLPPNCCAAVRSVKELSATGRARHSICECLRQLMVQVGKVDRRRASGLPGRCRIRTRVIPTSLHFDCFKVV